MTAYDCLALVTGALVARHFLTPVINVLIFYLHAFYWIVSEARFDELFCLTQDCYNEFKEIYDLDTTYYKYHEAMRLYEENARDKYKKVLLNEIRLHDDYAKYALIRIALTSVLFIPALFYYALGFISLVTVVIAYRLIVYRLNGTYLSTPAIILANKAYLSAYNEKLI